MSNKLDFLTRELVEQAAKQIDRKSLPAIKDYYVEIDGFQFPFKALVYKAAEIAGMDMDTFSFTSSHRRRKKFNELTNYKCLSKLNPIIKEDEEDLIAKLISKYKKLIKHTRLKDEIYKWKLLKEYQGRPDVQAENFADEIKSIDYRNLIYGIGSTIVKQLGKSFPKEYSKELELLFNNKEPLQNRISNFIENIDNLYKKIDQNNSHHHDERTIATLLAYYNGNEYPLYMYTFYQKYCSLQGIKTAPTGKCYVHYKELLEEFIEDYIKPDEELIQIKNEILTSDCFEDKNHLILAQDILYQMLSQNKIATENNKVNMKELSNILRLKFTNIWRCADSYKWEFLKNSDLLSFDWIDKYTNYKNIDIKSLPRGSRALNPWVNHLKTGDLVFIMGGNKYNGIAIAESTYNFDGPFINMGDSGEKPAIQVKYIHKLDHPISHGLKTHNNPTTFAKIDQYSFGLENVLNFLQEKVPEAIQAIFDYLDENPNTENNIKTEENQKISEPLNQILFGPPGTGKTYSTIDKAIEIVDPEFYLSNKNDRDKLKIRYRDLQLDFENGKGQIAFATFHQSMSYEDFVEGIKPIKEGNQIIYDVVDGIFKQISQIADGVYSSDFMDAYMKFVGKISEQEDFELQTKTGKSFWVKVNSNNNLSLYTTSEKNYQGTLVKERLNKRYKGSNEFIGWEGYAQSIIKHIKETYHVAEENGIPKNYVLIIDEINRGNVSAIFGELISLIEDDKRKNGKEALKAILPYSKEEFSIPSNLYIIGTMNTADRSVEALDTALRRRFSFKEIMPRYDLEELEYTFAESTANQILKTINQRIELLLDRDHLIGHSYLIKSDEEDTEQKLKNAFYNNIIPLLQEYFYGDYDKIGAVLGEGFVLKETIEDKSAFASGFNDIDFPEKEIYHFIDYREKNNPLIKEGMSFETAIKSLLKKIRNG